MGTQTIWGEADYAKKIARGIMSYSTPSHGGIHLSPSRQSEMPDALRIESGWYEEDCDWCLVAINYAEYFMAEYDQAMNTFKNWHPDRFEKHLGIELKDGESHVKDERLFKERNNGNFLVRTAWGDWHNKVPEGMVGVLAKRESDGKERYFLVPHSEYGSHFVVDIERHVEWEGTE